MVITSWRCQKREGQQSQMSPRENKKEGYGRRKEQGHLGPLEELFQYTGGLGCYTERVGREEMSIVGDIDQ